MKYQSVVRVTNMSTIEFRSEHVLLKAKQSRLLLCFMPSYLSLNTFSPTWPLLPGQPLSESFVFYLQDV